MSKGIFVVSLDTELAWGRLTPSDLQKYIPHFQGTRKAIHGILSLCERYKLSFTWAIVGRLLLKPPSSKDAYMWYGQDIVSAIMNCRVPQEIGCHSFSHIYYNSCSFREASFDLECCRNVFKAWGLAPRSFVFPGNKVGYLSLLKQYGFTCFRGPESHWEFNKNFLIVTSPLRFLHRLFFGPPVVKPKIAAGLVNIPGCMLFRVPNFKNFSIWYKILRCQVSIAKKGLLKAANNGMVFHLWFHPFQFGYHTKEMLLALDEILAFAITLCSANKLEVLTMAELAQRVLSRVGQTRGNSDSFTIEKPKENKRLSSTYLPRVQLQGYPVATNDTHSPFSVLLLGHCGRGNCGDDAMVYALLEVLGHIWPETYFTVTAPLKIPIPQALRGRLKRIPLRRGVILKYMLQAEVIIYSGGTFIQDRVAKRRYNMLLVDILCLSVLARVFGKKIHLVGIGLGPLKTWYGRTIARLIFDISHSISVRDSQSYRGIASLKCRKLPILGFDLVTLLDFQLSNQGENPTVGVSLLPFGAVYGKSSQSDEVLVKTVARGLLDWLDLDQHLIVRCFAFSTKQTENDIVMAQALAQELPPNRVKVIAGDWSMILREVMNCTHFIAMRFHAILFAFMAGLPTLVLAYHPKCSALARDIGLNPSGVLQMQDIVTKLGPVLKRLRENPESFKPKLTLAEARAKAERMFQTIYT